MRFATCAVLSFLCISIDHSNDHLAAIRSALSVLVYPVQYVVNAPVQFGADVAGNFRTRRHLIKQNERLKSDNLLPQLEKPSATPRSNRKTSACVSCWIPRRRFNRK